MKKYAGTKMLKAKPMNRGQYNEYKGWKIPDNENPEDDGYIVRYEDGHVSWSPKTTFESSYRECDALPFGIVIELIKQGRRAARKGWNGKGMFVVYQRGYPQGIPCNKQTAEAWGMNEGDLFVCNPYLQIQNVDGSHSMWVPSINDILSDDWYVL